MFGFSANIQLFQQSPASLIVTHSTMWCLCTRLERTPAATEQVEDQHNRCHNQQQVDQPTAHSAEQAQEPQHKKNNQYCPQHTSPPGSGLCPQPYYVERAHALTRLFSGFDDRLTWGWLPSNTAQF